MNKILLDAARRSIGDQPNKDIQQGLIRKDIKELPSVLDEVLRSVFKSPHFKYEGMERVDVKETLNHITNANGRVYDVNASDLYLVKLSFSHHGEMLPPRRTYLPFIDKEGYCSLGGTKYYFKPKLKDKCISASETDIFLLMLRYKVKVSFVNFSIMANDDIKTDVKIIHSDIYHPPANNTLTERTRVTRCKVPILIYLIVKKGLKHTLDWILGHDVEVVSFKEAERATDKDEYIYFTSRGIKPRYSYGPKEYEMPDVAFKVHKRYDSLLLVSTITNIIYIFDHFPKYITYKDAYDRNHWEIILGYILLGNESIPRNRDNLYIHLRTIEGYIDDVMIGKIYSEFKHHLGDFSKDGIYQMLYLVFKHFDEWTLSSFDVTASALDKRYETVQHILYPLIKAIHLLNYDINTHNNRSVKYIIDKLNRHITTGKIYTITSGKTSSLDVATTSGDHPYFKITSSCELRLNSAAGKVGLPGPTVLLSSTHFIAGTVTALSKQRLAPQQYINLFIPLDMASRTVILDKQTHEELEPLQAICNKSNRTGLKTYIPKVFNIYDKYSYDE